jgi:hypothetical protein
VDARIVLEASGVEYELRRQVRGRDAAEEILTAAQETGASLIVVGLRHRTPVGKLILGSTSQRVLLDAHQGPRNRKDWCACRALPSQNRLGQAGRLTRYRCSGRPLLP